MNGAFLNLITVGKTVPVTESLISGWPHKFLIYIYLYTAVLHTSTLQCQTSISQQDPGFLILANRIAEMSSGVMVLFLDQLAPEKVYFLICDNW